MAFWSEMKPQPLQFEPRMERRASTHIVTYSRKRKLDQLDRGDDNDNGSHGGSTGPQLSRPSNDLRLKDVSATVVAKQPLKRPPPKPRLVQMIIDLGGQQRKSCRECGMEYIPWDTADTKVHKKYHESIVNGLKLSPDVKQKMRVVRAISDGRINSGRQGHRHIEHLHSQDSIIEVGRKDEACLKSLAKRALENAEKDLGAVPLTADQLWRPLDACSEAKREADKTENERLGLPDFKTCNGQRKLDRFKFYLYVQNDRIIGLCLVEQILHAYRVLPTSSATEFSSSSSSSISRSENSTIAILGVSRIWVSDGFRGLSIATQLLNTACSNFFYGTNIHPNSVAFSQPTESGVKLARKWFGREDGWLVYEDTL